MAPRGEALPGDLRAGRLVGRAPEAALLRDAVDRAASGRGGTVLLLGEAGVGKSRLAREAAAAARAAGLVVLPGRASPGVPLRPLVEPLQVALRVGAVPDDPDLEPHLRHLVPATAPGRAGAATADPLATAEALLQVLRRCGGLPGALLLLEDLHRADAGTLAVLDVLVDHLDQVPLLLVGCLRDDERCPGLATAQALGDRRAARLLRLQRLGSTEAVALARDAAGGPLPVPVEQLLVERADGVPFLVEELLAGLVQEGALRRGADGGWTAGALVPVVPPAFADAVRRRLAGLPPDALACLRAAAVVGHCSSRSLLGPTAGLSEADALAGLRRACSAGLLRVHHDDTVRFRRALARDVVLADLLPSERAPLAARAADALERLAAQLLVAGDPPAACAEAERGLALRPGAVLEARLTALRAESLALVGDVGAALAAAEEAVRLAAALPAAGAPPEAAAQERARAHLLAARVAAAAERWEQVQAALDGAGLDEAGTDEAGLHQVGLGDAGLGDVGLGATDRARATVLAAAAARAAGRPSTAAALARSASRAAGAAAAPALVCEALGVLAAAVRTTDPRAARAALTTAEHLAGARGLALWRLRAQHGLALLEPVGARAGRLQAVRAAAAGAGAVAVLAQVEHDLAAVLGERERLAEAVALQESAAERCRALRLPLRGAALARLAALHAAADAGEACEAVLAAAREELPEDPALRLQGDGEARAVAALVAGRDHAALAALDHAAAVHEDAPHLPFALAGVWALLATALGSEDAGRRARARVRGGGARGAPELVAAGLLLADAVSAGRRDRAGAARLAEHALALLPGPDAAPLWHWTLLRLAAGPALRDGWGEPVAWLREAAGWYGSTDRPRAADACRARLRDAGHRLGRSGTRAPVLPQLRRAGVTEREAEVLALVAEGLSNAEVGARLFLSPRTVEKHVASLLARTGCRSRTQLAVLTRSG